MTGEPAGRARGLLFAPSSRYPDPVAYLVDDDGTEVHTWSNPACQPDPRDDPPNNLRGWNHVSVTPDGGLYAVVPLGALLRLTPDSDLLWSSGVTAHHDLCVDPSGTAVYVLTERPRPLEVDGRPHTVLDNVVTTLRAADGTVWSELSLYDVVRTEPALRVLLDGSVRRRVTGFRARGWPVPGDDVPPETVRRTRQTLENGRWDGELRQTLRWLRALPGSPCDVLHTNTLTVLDAHPDGLWADGDLLICLRELDVVAVVDRRGRCVRWWWGPGVLSGPHQPSVRPDGRILVFDNGVTERRSRLLVVDPSTREIVWEWTADPPGSFFCPLAGGCEALADGNILVTDSTAGAAFELAPNGRVVWELRLPVEVYGRERGRVSIYRMSVVPPYVLHRLRGAGHGRMSGAGGVVR